MNVELKRAILHFLCVHKMTQCLLYFWRALSPFNAINEHVRSLPLAPQHSYDKLNIYLRIEHF